jgi:hypothetical protein
MQPSGEDNLSEFCRLAAENPESADLCLPFVREVEDARRQLYSSETSEALAGLRRIRELGPNALLPGNVDTMILSVVTDLAEDYEPEVHAEAIDTLLALGSKTLLYVLPHVRDDLTPQQDKLIFVSRFLEGLDRAEYFQLSLEALEELHSLGEFIEERHGRSWSECMCLEEDEEQGLLNDLRRFNRHTKNLLSAIQE